jgi:hypothetical protein
MDDASHQTLYRGEYAGNRGGSFFSTDAEFALNFTQSGRPTEVAAVRVERSRIFEAETVPFAGDERAMEEAMTRARAFGFGAIWVDEGRDQPRSVFVLDKSILLSAAPVEKRGGVTGPKEALDALPPAAFRIASWADNASRKRQDEARRLLKAAGWSVETVPAPKDRLGPIPHEIYVYRTRDERRACFEANRPPAEPMVETGFRMR